MKDLDPVIILSAAPRMGTTLVQRLLCSAGDCLIYGDPVGHEASFLISWLSTKEFQTRHQSGGTDAMLAAVLAGDTSEFIAELAPLSGPYFARLSALAAGPLAHCKTEALAHGRPVWGWKLAGIQAWSVNMLPAALPKARVIVVDRDLAATARSAKTAGMYGPGPDFQRFLADTLASRAALAGMGAHLPVFHLQLEELLAEPERVIPALESFAGCGPIDRGVLSVKVNQPHSPYIPPVELTAEEATCIRQSEPAPADVLVA